MSTEVALPSGYLLNEYKIEAVLGTGGFGSTYLATDTNLNLQVAIKEYMPTEWAQRGPDHSVRTKSLDVEATFNWGRARFLEESRTLASFRHPNIVRVMRFFEANETAYMVMEFVAGQALHRWLKNRRPLDERVVLGIALPLLEGLEVVHRGGYLHRDIKPANIFLRGDGSPVLIDFGSSRAADGKTELSTIISPGFAPLEQYDTRGGQGPWSDLYAIGGVLYWMVTGQQPVEAPARVFSDPMVPAVSAAPGYSQSLLKAIDWALAPSKAARPQSVAELRDALQGSTGAPAPALAAMGLPMPAQAPSPAEIHAAQQLSEEAIAKLVRQLASHIGPIADKLVRSQLRKGGSLVQAAENLAAEIPDPRQRDAFIQLFATSRPQFPSSPAPSAPGPATSPSQRFSPQDLARAETDLAAYIGAVARVVVARAAAKAQNIQQLYSLLAEQIDNAEDRRAFMRKGISIPGRPH